MKETKDVQMVLEKLLQQELTELKRACFRYKHDIPFIYRDITIESDDLTEYKANGLYKKVEGKHKYDYTHRILIDTDIVNRYLRCRPNYYYGISKKFYKERIKRVVRHEIIHAFVEEHYGDWLELRGCNRDASPIFLSVLYFVGGDSNHECVTAYKKGELYHRLKDFKSFRELDTYLTQMLMDYNTIARKHKAGIKIGRDWVINDISFGSYNAGLNKLYQTRQQFISNNKSDLKALELNMFEIGCCTMPEQIDELVKTARYGEFDKYEYSKVGICNGDTIKTIYKVASGM